MGLFEVVRTRVAREETIYECRHCGVSVSSEAEACPACGTAEIARYEW